MVESEISSEESTEAAMQAVELEISKGLGSFSSSVNHEKFETSRNSSRRIKVFYDLRGVKPGKGGLARVITPDFRGHFCMLGFNKCP